MSDYSNVYGNSPGYDSPVEGSDPVNHPSHYTDIVPGIECIDVVKHFDFCRGNAIKYLWRAGNKNDIVEDLQKAIFYINQEIKDIVNGRN